MKHQKANLRVIVQSLIALVCVALMFFVHWLFVIPAAVLVWMNHRLLFPQNIERFKYTK